MTYYKFVSTAKEYLKSVRVIKDYISFDMIFSDKWVILKEHSIFDGGICVKRITFDCNG